MTCAEDRGDDVRLAPRRALVLMLVLGMAAMLGSAVWSLPASPPGLTDRALAHLPASGVANPVAAAVLNYRAYDTLLELAVLLVAALGVWSMAVADPLADIPGPPPLLRSFVRLALPMMTVVAGYLLWVGSTAPGGAFQAGALAAGAAVLALSTGVGTALAQCERAVRTALAVGLATFVAVGGGVAAGGGRFLEYRVAQAGMLILVIEIAAGISIATTLTVLYLGGRPPRGAVSGTSRGGGDAA